MSYKEIEKLKKEKKKAEAKGDLSEVAGLCNVIGEAYAKLGDFESAIAEHETEFELSQLLGDHLGVAIAHRKIGERHCELGNFTKAVTNHKIYLEGAEKCGSAIEQQRAQATIGRTYLLNAEAVVEGQVGDVSSKQLFSKAQAAFESSLKLCDKIRNQISEKESAEMKSGLYLNLGLVYGYKNNQEKAIGFMKRAVSLAIEYSLHEMLYLANSSLAVHYQTMPDMNSALLCFLAALESAQKLHNKNSQVETLCNVASIYLSMSSVEQAKKTIRKAHKLAKTSLQPFKDMVVNRFKSVIKISKMQDDLEKLSKGDDEGVMDRVLKMYENLGDSMAELSLFHRALEYYHKQLKGAITSEWSSDALCTIYVSLSQTYKDLKEYQKAMKYGFKELHCRTGDQEQQCRTLLNIADAAELGGETYTKVKGYYEDAMKKATMADHSRLQVRCLRSLAVSQLNFNEVKDRIETLKKLVALKVEKKIGDEEEEEESQPLLLEEEEADEQYILDELSESDDSDSEEHAQLNGMQAGRARRVRGIDLKRNEKGETALHRACIEGKISKVQALLDKGHPIHVRDNCGWQPIHESCNHGFTDIVELLLDRGANINDPGGEQCGGITPLHDAASAGNLHIMSLLLKRGADVNAVDEDGSTPLSSLQDWMERETDPFSQDSLQEITVMENRLISAMKDKTAAVKSNQVQAPTQDLPEISSLRSRAMKRKPSSRSKTLELLSSQRNRSQAKKRQRGSSSESEGDDSVLQVFPESEEDGLYLNPALRDIDTFGDATSATDSYKQAMENIGARSRTAAVVISPPSPTQNAEGPALITEEEVLQDDWLIDDLPQTSKTKRKRVAMDVFVTRGTRRTSSGDKNTNVTDTQTSRQSSRDNISPFDDSRGASNATNSHKLARKRNQLTLTQLPSPVTRNERQVASDDDFMDSDNHNFAPLSPFLQDPIPPSTYTQLGIDATQNVTSSIPPAVHQQPVFENFNPNVIRLNVRIEGKLIMVPFELDTQPGTVHQLARAAADRYKSSSHTRPNLSLSTKEGAELSPHDVVSLVLSNNQEIIGTVTGYEEIPLLERFEEACRIIDTDCHRNTKKILEDGEKNQAISLQRCHLRTPHLKSIFQALDGQSNLRELDLTGTSQLGQSMASFCKVLPSFTGLEKLNLTLCRLTCESLRKMEEVIAGGSPNLKALKHLNLSMNPLQDNSSKHIAAIVKHLPELKQLNLSSTNLTVAFLQHHRIALAGAFSGGKLQHLICSHNKLGILGVELLLMCLNPKNLLALDIGGTISQAQNGHLPRHLLRIVSQGSYLQELNLDSTSLTDDDGPGLARFLEQCPSLQKLSLNCNKLSSVSLSLLLQSSSANTENKLHSMNFSGCGLSSPFDTAFVHGIDSKLKHNCPLDDLTFSCQYLTSQDTNVLQDTWWSKWKDRSNVSFKKSVVKLSIKL